MTDSLVGTIERLMAAREWTQADLARVSGLSRTAISNILNGKRQAGVDALTAIAGAFKIPPEELFQAAGILPREAQSTLLERRFVSLLQKMPEERRMELLRFAEFLAGWHDEDSSDGEIRQ